MSFNTTKEGGKKDTHYNQGNNDFSRRTGSKASSRIYGERGQAEPHLVAEIPILTSLRAAGL